MFVSDYQADVRVQLDGRALFGAWATYSGGDKTASDAKTRPGNMGDEVSTGGLATRNDATLTIQWSDEVIAGYQAVEDRIGVGDVLISLNWKDKEHVPIPGALFKRSGTLKGFSDPAFDHNGNAVGMATMVVSCDEQAPA